MPPEIRLPHPEFFEDEEYEMTLRFNSAENLGSFLEQLGTKRVKLLNLVKTMRKVILGEDEKYMRLALAEAKKALEEDEVPVGAVVRLGDEVIGRAYDRRQHGSDPTAHAELLALRQAAVRVGDWRLENCILYTTLEPCPMCAGALILARIKCLVYGAPNLKFGAVATKFRLLDCADFNHSIEVISGVLAQECSALLSQFFSQKREREI